MYKSFQFDTRQSSSLISSSESITVLKQTLHLHFFQAFSSRAVTSPSPEVLKAAAWWEDHPFSLPSYHIQHTTNLIRFPSKCICLLSHHLYHKDILVNLLSLTFAPPIPSHSSLLNMSNHIAPFNA